MSIETARAFLNKIKGTPELQAQINQRTETNPVDFLQLGAEYGFEFTEVEWYQALHPNEKDVLGSFELDAISGNQGKVSRTEWK
ncbi:MAG: Nif11-like leader peptide family natural product precursor [Candidatus Tectomicrobia bacterium]|nr:Nif11-like leader peptide family natural product precursor [Candidatus Tectomicrobia bacterium]